MKKNVLCALWGGMFILCAGLGFIPEPSAYAGNLMTLAAVLFFLPPALLLWQAHQAGDRPMLRLVRNLSLLSLGLSLVLIVLNILSAMSSEVLGDLLNSVLIVVSSPMICSGSWALSLFLWACLMVVSMSLLKKHRQ